MRWLKYGVGVMFTATFLSCRGAAVPRSETPSLEEIARRYTRRTAGGVHLPIVRQVPTETSKLRRRGLTSAIGLGDFVDLYNVLISIGGTTTPLLLDTGSSDLWVVSDDCTQGCSSSQSAYPHASLQYSGADGDLWYGDSNTITHASGKIGKDTVTLAGLTLQDQYFIAVNRTNVTLGETGSSGIFGLGFPVISDVAFRLWNQSRSSISTKRQVTEDNPIPPSNIKLGSRILPSFNFRRIEFPILSDYFSSPGKQRRQTLASGNVSSSAASIFHALSVFGPLLTRFVAAAQLTLPMFTVTLQRDAIQVGGNVGMLSIGEMPSGVSEHNLTWVPIRAYPYLLPAPTDSPNEMYPLTWEIPLDDVYLDGVKLPRSTLSSPFITLSALVDSGNSILRGPADVVRNIQSKLGINGRFRCSEPHTIAFSIGGQLFPVDPRDFIQQVFENDVAMCTSMLAPTDPPALGRVQFSWSLGDPFLKSVLAAFYYGNITHPSHDPPKMGFLSTVPQDAASQLVSAVAAVKTGDNFPYISEVAPSGTFKPAGTASNGVPLATATGRAAG
ncbi:uncharacterized protein LACBIDRAFT_318129 [Laccaria bicolor S238N-H82]|uniref:Predicted protein n=1 Tax=Laccaria bicolor (strain S238N-H82 / ATCC MYA-4686) TaxID=486041 RepID=B0D623_LACBS|nr:uncharacterized protein LACBIDRAFT_318129 [Laccaria bicolor S238N-H82]EDR10123.1 predicted protein [Laccaria bicolor S238N-H82]|eukprot:XP_001879508.1 predicted protein [Laccaria bicolor S238N-H82]